MKLIIDIPKELKSEVYRCGVFLSPIEKESLINAINNGTPIPDNATNGDVMKIIFPQIGVYDEWYDEPYQKGGKE